MSRKARGRPLKFGRPARLLALTLPHDVVRGLRRIHPDPAWAIVALYDRVAPADRPAGPARPPATELVELSPRSALIVVDPRTVRSVPGVSVVPVTASRAFLAFDQGRGLADLELAIRERRRARGTSRALQKQLTLVQQQLQDWRRSRRFRLSTRSIILVERVSRRPRSGRGRGPRDRTARSG